MTTLVRRTLMALTLASLMNMAAAQERSWGAWSAGRTSDGDGTYAATMNDSGNILGQYCNGGTCVYLLGIKTSCKTGDKYPALVNSNLSAMSVEVVCRGKLDNGMYRYVFTDFEQIDDTVKRASQIGFAVPLAGDQFRVIRFDLMGSTRRSRRSGRRGMGGIRGCRRSGGGRGIRRFESASPDLSR